MEEKKFTKAYELIRTGDIVIIQKKGEENPEEEAEVIISKTEGKLTTFYPPMLGYLPRDISEIARVIGREERPDYKEAILVE